MDTHQTWSKQDTVGQFEVVQLYWLFVTPNSLSTGELIKSREVEVLLSEKQYIKSI